MLPSHPFRRRLWIPAIAEFIDCAFPTSSARVASPDKQQFFQPESMPEVLHSMLLPLKIYISPRQFPSSSLAPSFVSIVLLFWVIVSFPGTEGSVQSRAEHCKTVPFRTQPILSSRGHTISVLSTHFCRSPNCRRPLHTWDQHRTCLWRLYTQPPLCCCNPQSEARYIRAALSSNYPLSDKESAPPTRNIPRYYCS